MKPNLLLSASVAALALLAICVAQTGAPLTPPGLGAGGGLPAPAIPQPIIPSAGGAPPGALPGLPGEGGGAAGTGPSDPFVRGGGAGRGLMAGGSGTPGMAAEEAPGNLLTVLETWSLSQADFAALLDGPADERAPYDRLEALAKDNKAKLVGLIAISTRSGQRAVVESIDELRYPTVFSPAQRNGELAYPTAFETRNVGDTLEIEPVIGPDGKTIDVNLVPQTVRFAGFQDWQPEALAAPMATPLFHSERVTTSMTVQSGRPSFLATASPAPRSAGTEPDASPEVQIRVLRATAQPPPAPTTVVTEPSDVRVEFLLYSMPREVARRILADTANSVESHAAVRALVGKGEAKLETVSAFVTKSGQRAVNEECFEYRYPTEMQAPSYLPQVPGIEGRMPASFSAFETRNTGVIVEIEPAIGPGGKFVDINVVPQVVRMSGLLKANGAAANYPAQPVFTTRKVTTSVSTGAGLPVLVGTMSQPRDTNVNGRQDDGRIGLAYIRVTPFRR